MLVVVVVVPIISMVIKRVVFKAATGLYKPVGGAGASFCIISNMLHIRDPFFKITKYLQIMEK